MVWLGWIIQYTYFLYFDYCSGGVLGELLSYSYLFYILKLVFDDLTISFISNALYNKVKIKIKKKIKTKNASVIIVGVGGCFH